MSTIVRLLEEAQERFRDRPALAMRRGYRTQRWSYRQLWDSSGMVAARLQQEGIQKGDRVIICAQNSPQWVTAFLGCLRAGAVLVPLDVRSTGEFAVKVAKSTGSRLAFVSSGTRPQAQGLGLPLVALEELESFVAEALSLPEAPPLAAGDIAEIIFTSGTTGDPKGVLLTHGNIVSNVLSAGKVVPVKPSYRLLSLLPLSHMLEQTVGLLAPLSGGAAIIYPHGRQPGVIFRAFKEHHITSLVLVPQALQLFMNAMAAKAREQGKAHLWKTLLRAAGALPIWARRVLFRSVHRQLGGKLRFVMCGGAYLDPALAQQWEALGVYVLQGYGTTETSPIISCNSFGQRRLDSLGKPIPGVQVKLAEDGEVLVRGPNVTPGYWRNAEATEVAFADGWYRTGDLGALDRDGFLYFRGRKKDVIVLASGMNVYPEDIEALLRRHPAVADAAVVGLPRNGQEVEAHAALLLKDKAASPKAILEEVNEALADHQKVRGCTPWPEEDFPRTHTLKVKKHEVLQRLALLRAGNMPATKPDLAPPQASPLCSLAAQIARLPVAQATPTARLGPDMGLDSLGRVELLAAVESELGVYLDDAHVSGETTLEELETLAARAGGRQQAGYAQWPLHPLVRVLRAAAQAVLFGTIVRWFAPRDVQGLERLKGLKGPVLFASNHQSHADTPVILASLPRRWRRRVAVAAAADHWFAKGRLAGGVAAFMFNAFPFSRTDSIRPSLERCSQLQEGGWSVLIYPEGTRSPDGRMGPFKSGTGLMAVELGAPVVPVRVEGTYAVLPRDGASPRRGKVRVKFGKPIVFPSGVSYLEATRTIEAAVTALSGFALHEASMTTGVGR
ncbi:MAG: AMP-binding protein [Chloroflexi bacterium]|nr:AMP-binding protein [Chloroflexota bacterium]